MLARALCFALNGIQGEPVMVEADVSNSDKFVFNLVGLPDAAVKESRERVFAALKNSGFTQPYVRTTVNLSLSGSAHFGDALRERFDIED